MLGYALVVCYGRGSSQTGGSRMIHAPSCVTVSSIRQKTEPTPQTEGNFGDRLATRTSSRSTL